MFNKVNFLRGEEKVVVMSVGPSLLLGALHSATEEDGFSSSRAGCYRPRASPNLTHNKGFVHKLLSCDKSKESINNTNV